MLAIAFRFPAGRYHANPWGRHVNEADIAWPPEPWRIVRALIATWHLKVRRKGASPDTLRSLVEKLAQGPPRYRLPQATHAHTRHYLPQWKAGDTSLVFDAFARVQPEDDLGVVWPDAELTESEAVLLDELLRALGYLGRAESWVEARRLQAAPDTDCIPLDDLVDEETGEVFDQVTLLTPIPSADYDTLRKRIAGKRTLDNKLKKTLPQNYLDALCADTGELQGAGWPHPPAARPVFYGRPSGALRARASVSQRETSKRITTVVYRLVTRPLPRIEDAVRIGEDMRRAVMGAARRRLGEDAVPRELSGHDLPANSRHEHAFFLPEDVDGDGRVERLVVHAPGGLGTEAMAVLSGLRRVRASGGAEWTMLHEWAGVHLSRTLSGSPLLAHGRTWLSVTPYLHPWHLKKTMQVDDQVRRECRERGLPEPIEIQRLPWVEVRGRRLNPIRFRRFRSKSGLIQADTHGCFLRLRFSAPIEGPLALGFACHFGLGLFQAVKSEPAGS